MLVAFAAEAAPLNIWHVLFDAVWLVLWAAVVFAFVASDDLAEGGLRACA